MVSYNNAKLAKTLGYNGPCDYIYTDHYDLLSAPTIHKFDPTIAFFCYAPWESELINWLKSVHNLDIKIHEYLQLEFNEDPQYMYDYTVTNILGITETSDSWFDTYAEAQNNAITKTLNKI